MARQRENVERFAYYLNDVEGHFSNEELVKHVGLAYDVARRYKKEFLWRCRVDYDEVVSVGLLALVEGNREYTKYSSGKVDVIPFLKTYVRRSVWYFLLWNRSLILLAQRKYKNFSKLSKSGDLSALADQEAAAFALWATGELGSTPPGDGDVDDEIDSAYYDMFERAAISEDCPEQLFIGAEKVAIANRLLEDFKATLDSSKSPGLRARREELLAKRILVPDEDKESLQTIADRWGVTKQVVSVIEKSLSAKFDAFVVRARKNIS